MGVAGTHAEHANPKYLIDFSRFIGTEWDHQVDTTISQASVEKLSELITTIPDDFELNPAVSKIIESRKKMGKGEMLMDWGYAETIGLLRL